MTSAFRNILILSALLVLGCDGIAGGGGSVNVPPASITYGQTTPLRLELSVWGAGSGKMTDRHTDVRCHYKTEKAASFAVLEGQVERETNDRMFVTFELPAFSTDDGAYVEYFIDMKLDGQYNKRDIERVPLK